MDPELTRILTSEHIEEAVSLLLQGHPIAFPTETVYGLGAPLFLEMATLKLYSLKGRARDNPLIVHIAEMQELHRLSAHVPSAAIILTEKFFPGPLTLLLKKSPLVPSCVTAGLDTVALRMPSHPVALQLIRKLGQPIAAPSANLSGKPSSTCVEHVLEDFEGKIAAVLDGGPCLYGLESTVLSLVDPERPVLLRPGHVTKEQIESCLGRSIFHHEEVDGVALCPGMKYRHYAPNAPLRLISSMDDYEEGTLLVPTSCEKKPANALSYSAKNLYALLRKADREGAKQIFVYCDASTESSDELMNRLFKASGKN